MAKRIRQRGLLQSETDLHHNPRGPARAPAPASPPLGHGLSGRPRLRVSRVVALAGHLFARRLGVSSQSRAAILTRPSVSWDEIVLVGVLRRSDRGVAS